MANIRGGGEFGPRWHKAGLKKNRHKVYEDFIAVAEDLIKRKITSPGKLGIRGGSNGGLLVGVAFTMRPDLFKAVGCAAPLLDMKRYSKLLAGASWIAEYGDPDIPDMWEYIKTYSVVVPVFPANADFMVCHTNVAHLIRVGKFFTPCRATILQSFPGNSSGLVSRVSMR